MLRYFLDRFFFRKPFLAIWAAVYASVAIASIPVFVRVSETGPFATAFFRFFISFPILMTWMIFDSLGDPHSKTPRTGRDYFLILGAGVFLAGDLCFWHWSIMHTTVVNATLLNNLTILIVPLMSWFLWGKKPGFIPGFGMFLVFSGSVVLMGDSLAFNAENLQGDIFAFISAFFYSAFILAVTRLRLHFRTPTILAWGAIPVIYILAVIGYFHGDNFVPHTVNGWLCLIGLAVFVHVFGQGMLTYAMAHLSPSLSALILGFSPVFAAVFAWILFGESITLFQGAGAFVMLLGIMIARRGESRIHNHKEKKL